MRFTTFINYITSCINGDFKFEDLYREQLIKNDELYLEIDNLHFKLNTYRIMFYTAIVIIVGLICFMLIKRG